jgi:hypothetical protein
MTKKYLFARKRQKRVIKPQLAIFMIACEIRVRIDGSVTVTTCVFVDGMVAELNVMLVMGDLHWLKTIEPSPCVSLLLTIRCMLQCTMKRVKFESQIGVFCIANVTI